MTEGIRHSWHLTPREAVALQRELAGLVRQESLAGPVNTVGGVDCAFTAGGRQIIAAAVLMEAGTGQLLARAYAVDSVLMPYVPGLLSFREAPAELAAIGELPRRPDLLLVDGSGVAHPRRLGIASHLGLWLDLPTIGVAKSRLCGTHRNPAAARGRKCNLMYDGKPVGVVLRTQDNVKPLYVSPGHRVTMNDCVRYVLRAARKYRLPEPSRLAHHLVTMRKKQLVQESG